MKAERRRCEPSEQIRISLKSEMKETTGFLVKLPMT